MSKRIVALFSSREKAEGAAEEIQNNVANTQNISVKSLADIKNKNKNMSDDIIIGNAAEILFGPDSFIIPGYGILSFPFSVNGISKTLSDIKKQYYSGNEYEDILAERQNIFSIPLTEENGGIIYKILKAHGGENISVSRHRI